ncbi:uncharacterized protein VTP21DRAFT_5779 [Calcarisporiella thermophila]|uniref:uncharacterized protein n=1 Tax=Calcarisporiella thermophila TaxID=911321 RepID=UPI003743EC0F
MNRFSTLRPAGHSLFRQAIFRPTTHLSPVILSRLYSSSLPREEIERRVLDVLAKFDKIDKSKVSLDSHFINDLNLDSLDAVEVVMSIEEEFSVEIPDKEADEIKTPRQAVEYLTSRDDAN